jgi:hypothetical protein
MRNALLVTILALTTTAHAAAPKKAESKAEEAKKDGPVSMVLCAPGYAGSTKEAQPSIDALMKALAQSAKWDGKDLLGAYYETDKDGIAALSKPDAALAMVTLAFFLEQQDAAKLTPRMLASMKDRPAMERWALAAKKGTVKDAASLDGFTIASGISFSPRFVRGPVLGAWGKLPESVKFQQSKQPLSDWRKAHGDKVAVLLDEEMVKALPSLAWASDLEVVYTSPPVPAAVVATVLGRLSDARWKTMAEGLVHLADSPDGVKALEAVWKLKFFPLDEKAVAAAQKAFKDVK